MKLTLWSLYISVKKNVPSELSILFIYLFIYYEITTVLCDRFFLSMQHVLFSIIKM